MFFNSIKEINRLRKKINRLWNVKYLLRSYFWGEKLTFSKLFLGFWGSPTDESIIKFWNFLLQLIKQKYGNKTMSDFSIISFFKGINYNFLKSERTCILLNKNINFNKSETDSKMENPTHTFRETKLALQVISQLRIKSNTVMSWSSQKKKEDIFCTVYFVRRNFF